MFYFCKFDVNPKILNLSNKYYNNVFLKKINIENGIYSLIYQENEGIRLFENKRIIFFIESYYYHIEENYHIFTNFFESLFCENLSNCFSENLKNCLQKIDGPFRGVFLLKDENRVISFTDRLALMPVYYSRNQNNVEITSNPLLSNKFSLNSSSAMSLCFLSYNVFYSKCINENYQQLEFCTYFDNQNKNFLLKKYYDLFLSVKTEESYKNSLETLTELYYSSIKKALDRFNDELIFIQLSGGVDSRGLLSAVMDLKRDFQKIISFTYGSSSFIDNIYAKKISERLQFKSINIDLTESNYLEIFTEATFLSGLENRIDDTVRNFGIYKRNLSKRPIFSALIIDSMLGDENEQWMRDYKGINDVDDIEKRLIDYLSFFLSQKPVFEQEFINGLVKEIYKEVRTFDRGLQTSEFFDRINILLRHSKGTAGMIRGHERDSALIIPFINNRLLNFSLSLPASYKQEAKIYLEMLDRQIFNKKIRFLPTTRGHIALSKYLGKKFGIEFSRFNYIKSRIEFGSNRIKLVKKSNKDYHLDIIKHKDFKDFVNDNILSFINKKILPFNNNFINELKNNNTDYTDVHQVRRLLTIASINHIIDRNFF